MMPKRLTPKMIEEYRDQSWAYKKFSPLGKLHLVCPQCRAPVLIGEDLTPGVRRNLARLRQVDFGVAKKSIRRAFNCDERQAKVIYAHICETPSTCNRCRSSIPHGALLCANCWSVNLDW